MSELPSPLTDLSIDLTGIDGFILDTKLLADSDLLARSTGDEFKAAVRLWCKAWAQRPVASLPDDERVLASFAGYENNRRGWARVREVALKKFIKCSDGRLYHPVLAADAKRAWRNRQQKKSAANSRWGNDPAAPAPEPPDGPKPNMRPESGRTSERNASPVQSSPKPEDLKNLRGDFGSGGVALLRPGSKSLKPRGIDWGAVVTRMQSHGFTAEEAWTLCSGIGDDESYGRRMQGAMRDAEAKGKIAYLALTTIASEATNSRRTA